MNLVKGYHMIFAIDVGNTNITCAVMEKMEVKASFRITTKMQRTSDEFGILMSEFLHAKGIDIDSLKDVIISSVVPGVMHSLVNGVVRFLNKKPLIVGEGTRTGLKIQTAAPKEIGADRIVDAVAAYDLYGGPLVVCDFGTATTYDVLTEDGTFIAGITSPGIRISANALWNDTAKLPEIEIEMPDSILAKDTVTSMQAGLVYGCIGQTDYIIKKIIEETGFKDTKIIATGGLGRLISDNSEMIQIYDKDLTMKGLWLIYSKTKK